MNAIANLLALSRSYLAATGVEGTTLSFRMFNDSKKLAAIEGGASITVDRYERAVQWLSNNWPEGAVWPEAIARPAAGAAAQ